MVAYRTDDGFTLVELIVALVVLAVFLTLFFQLFFTTTSERLAITRRAAATDTALTNLRKYPTANSIPTSTQPSLVCDTTVGSGNTNNLVLNQNAAGVEITSFSAIKENPVPAPLNNSTTEQHIYVIYPRGCGFALPTEVKSTVLFDGPNGQETATRATFVN